MTNLHQQIWEIYTSSWKAATSKEKQELFEQSLTSNCTYRDPLEVTHGWDALISYMLEFHKMIPGGHFITREFKSHNNRSIAEWNMCSGDGTIVGNGISYGEYNEEGKLTSMNGFFDPPETE